MKKELKESLKKIYWPYCVYREFARLKADRKQFLEDAVFSFKVEKPQHGSLADYKRALAKHRITYREYMYLYEYWRIDEKKRNEYISESEMRCIYRKTVKKSISRIIDNKYQALMTFGEHVRRRWLYAPKASFESFCEFVNSIDCLAKPVYGSLGRGIVKINRNDEKDLMELYANCCENNMVLEECARSIKDLEEFHPQSLNTIRVMTVSKGRDCKMLGALFRMGVGDSFVDNSSSGGVFASIDLETGELLTDGHDKYGKTYKLHPDTAKPIKGFVIPYWEKVKEFCGELTSVVPELVFAGWDLNVCPDGEIELIEGNSAPNVYGGLQAPLKKGLKPMLNAAGKEILGYDPLKLISIWSKSYVELEERCSL
jgi:hypothetical protein